MFRLDGQRLTQSLMRRQVKRRVEGIAEELGPVRLRWMIEHNASFAELIPKAHEDRIRQRASALSRTLSFITDEQVKDMLPEWASGLVAEAGDSGEQWLEKNLAWIKGVIAGGASQS